MVSAVARLLLPCMLVSVLALAGCAGSERPATPAASPEPVASSTQTVVVPSPTAASVAESPGASSPIADASDFEADLVVRLDAGSSAVVLEGTEVRLQFLEVFEAGRCPAEGTCRSIGAGMVLVGLSGPGVFPFITELYLATPVYGVVGYDLRLESIERTGGSDTVEIAVAATSGGLSGGVIATFRVGRVGDEPGETFTAWITDPTTAGQLVALSEGAGTATFLAGPILPGPGVNNLNAPWKWHLDPAAARLVASADESCDALPSQLEAERDFWLDVVGSYCPRSTELVGVRDLR